MNDEKEEGEISLEDVSSSDDGHSSYGVPWIHSVTSPTRRSHSLRDAGHGKENRRYSRDLTARYLATLRTKSEVLQEISSDDEHEIVELPDSSHRLYVNLGKKKRKKRKKKKSSGGGPMSLDDFVSVTDPDPLILSSGPPRTEITVHRRRRSTSPKVRRHSPFTRTRDISRSPPTTPPRLHRPQLRRSPSPRPHRYSSSPSPRRRSPKRRSRSPVPSKKSHRHSTPDASSLLKKVRRLGETGGITFTRIHKDGSSLKDKLSNILNTKQAPNPAIKQLQGNENEESSEGGDDIEVLRTLALQTKQQKSDKTSSEPDHLSDNDPEDLELRMIALKSAVIKKHEERIKKKKKRDSLREKSPFCDSFLDHESSPDLSDTRQVEDMELDTDVEREKECFSPYSPYSPSEDSPEIHYRNMSSAPDVESGKTEDLEAPYSPTDPAKTPWVDRFKKEKRKNILKTITIKSDAESSDEAPYSPSDTPRYDPELPCCPPDLLDPQDDDNCVALDLSMKERPKNDEEIAKKCSEPVQIVKFMGTIQIASISEPPGVVPPETPAPVVPPEPQTAQETPSKQIEEETNPINCSKDSEPSKIEDNSSKRVDEDAEEPSYLRGLSDVPEGPNKIPILVNKSLVPASILKSNKNLQQKLPQKKVETSSEKVFKSAEMQPVDVETEPSVAPSVFKPIKLQPVMKKSTVVASAAAFNNISTDEVNLLDSEDVLKVVETGNDEKVDDADKVSSERSRGLKNDPKKSEDDKNSSGVKSKKKRGRRGGRKTLELRRKYHLEKEGIIKGSSGNSALLHDQTNPEDSSKTSERKLSSRRSEPIDKKSRSNEKENLSVIEVSRLESSMKKVEQKKDVENVQTAASDKKRRNSIEEDEETLRAILLASLAKRPKSGEGMRSEEVSRSAEGSPKVQKVPEEKDKVIVESCEVINKQNKEIIQSPVSAKRSEVISGGNKASTPVLKSSAAVQHVDEGLNAVVEARKRANPSVIKGPPKKLMKKVAIPVSTKVVNNAKKFQNTMMQRKLILQAQGKVITSATSVSKNLTLNNLKSNEVPRSVSPKIKASGQVQRLVIKLGEDSDSDSGGEGGPKEGGGGERAELAIPTTDFEKSVDQFLKEQRKKQEIMALGSTAVTSTPTGAVKGGVKVADGLSGTPLAVRHLPPSQQEEYKRLKQKILEKERQRANRQINTPSSPSSPASPLSKILSKPSILTKPSIPPSQDPKTPPKVLLNPKILSKSLGITSNSPQNSSQPKSTPKSGPTDQSINAPSPSGPQPMKNLSIQIANDHLTPGGRLVFNKPEHSDQESSKIPSSLRILTTDQLNSKFVQVQLKLGERKVTLGGDKAVESHDKSMGELLQCNETVITSINGNSKEINGDLSEKSENQASLNDDKSSEASTVIIEPQNRMNQPVGDAGSSKIDSEPSTVILPPRDGGDDAGEGSREDSGNSTIVLDDSIEERGVVEAQKSPIRTKNRSPTKENSERIKSDVRAALENLGMLGEEEQKKTLEEIERKLVIKRYSVLDDLTEMSSTLKQWDLERELQTNLFAEVRRLRAQLAIAEERLLEQRVKIDNIGPKVTKAHKTIVEGRTECLKLTKLCQGIGNKVVGQQYKVPVTGAQLMMERLKEVAYHTRQLSKKKVPCENINNELGSVSDEQKDRNSSESEVSWGEQSDGNGDNSEAEQSDNATGVVISRSIEEPVSLRDSGENSSTEEGPSPGGSMDGHQGRRSHVADSYQSVLASFRTPRHIDPNRELCPFELTGVCKDDGCLYNHLEPRSQMIPR